MRVMVLLGMRSGYSNPSLQRLNNMQQLGSFVKLNGGGL